jgi:hypothetical protein
MENGAIWAEIAYCRGAMRTVRTQAIVGHGGARSPHSRCLTEGSGYDRVERLKFLSG